MNPNSVSLDVCMVFPRQVDRQKYRAVGLEASLTHMVGALHLPVIVRDDVPISH